LPKLSSVRITVEGLHGTAQRSIAVASDLIEEPDTPRHKAGREAVTNRIVNIWAEAYAEANTPPADEEQKPSKRARSSA
jgi:hypothetical protein